MYAVKIEDQYKLKGCYCLQMKRNYNLWTGTTYFESVFQAY